MTLDPVSSGFEATPFSDQLRRYLPYFAINNGDPNRGLYFNLVEDTTNILPLGTITSAGIGKKWSLVDRTGDTVWTFTFNSSYNASYNNKEWSIGETKIFYLKFTSSANNTDCAFQIYDAAIATPKMYLYVEWPTPSLTNPTTIPFKIKDSTCAVSNTIMYIYSDHDVMIKDIVLLLKVRKVYSGYVYQVGTLGYPWFSKTAPTSSDVSALSQVLADLPWTFSPIEFFMTTPTFVLYGPGSGTVNLEVVVV